MARTWLAIRVELLGGGGTEPWPPPGRVMVVGPRHTFADLAAAIDDAFARWDRAHLCQFTLADGRTVTDAETAEESEGSPFGPIGAETLILDRTKVLKTVGVGEEFRYVFDFGDGWTHRCTVEEKVDPAEALGVVPDMPLPMWGWGSIPDQYGRRWADDDGEAPVPRQPQQPDPMLSGTWPELAADPVDVRELRGATFRGDVAAIRAALQGRDPEACLQHAGAAVSVLLAADRKASEGLALSVVNRLGWRGAEGDEVLAADLIEQLRGTAPPGRLVATDLDEVASLLEGDGEGGYLDLQTGEVVRAAMTDPAEVGEDEAVDVDEDPERWLFLESEGSRGGWRDMADFAATVGDAALRSRLDAAIEGRGAFRRFRDEIDRAGLVDRWRGFSDDRKLGRARARLADRGVRVRPAAPHPG